MSLPKKEFKPLDEKVQDIEKIIIDDDVHEIVSEKDSVVPIDDVDDVDIRLDETSDTVTITPIRANLPPKRMWSDEPGAMIFSIGQLVIVKGYPKTIYKVVSAGTYKNTYDLKRSGSDTISTVGGDVLKVAPDGAQWVSIWATVTDPYRDWVEAQKKKKEQPEEKTKDVKNRKNKSTKKKK